MNFKDLTQYELINYLQKCGFSRATTGWNGNLVTAEEDKEIRESYPVLLDKYVHKHGVYLYVDEIPNEFVYTTNSAKGYYVWKKNNVSVRFFLYYSDNHQSLGYALVIYTRTRGRAIISVGSTEEMQSVLNLFEYGDCKIELPEYVPITIDDAIKRDSCSPEFEAYIRENKCLPIESIEGATNVPGTYGGHIFSTTDGKKYYVCDGIRGVVRGKFDIIHGEPVEIKESNKNRIFETA